MTFGAAPSRSKQPCRDLPWNLRDRLSRPPSAGNGVHRWLFSRARELHVRGGVKVVENGRFEIPVADMVPEVIWLAQEGGLSRSFIR
jgi:hypothetical protein